MGSDFRNSGYNIRIVNLQKIVVYIGTNIGRDDPEMILEILGIGRAIGNGSYLGLPMEVERFKKKVFSYIKERAWKRILGWYEHSLFKGGKEVLLKVIIQLIPSFIMSVLKLLSLLLLKLDSMMTRF